MNFCVVVQARGKELDYLRGEAYRVARDASTDWYAEPRDLGTAFCFENANVRPDSVRFVQRKTLITPPNSGVRRSQPGLLAGPPLPSA